MNEKLMKASRKWQTIFFILLIIGMTLASSEITGFNIIHGIITLPKAGAWILSNMMITQESLERLPTILEKLLETILMSIAATTTGTAVAFFLSLMGSKTTGTKKVFGVFARFVASLSRNIPVVAWALILLLSFGLFAAVSRVLFVVVVVLLLLRPDAFADRAFQLADGG